MFRRLTVAIFWSYMKYLLSRFVHLLCAVCSGEMGGEVDTRSRMCLEVGRCGYMGGLCYYILCLY